MVTCPAGSTARRLNGEAAESTGSPASAVPASARDSAPVCTRCTSSMTGVGFSRASAADRGATAVPTGVLT